MHVMYTSQTLSFHSYMNVCDFVDYFKNRNRNEDPWNWSNTPNYFWIKKSRGLSVVVLVLLCSIVHTISTSNHTYCIYLEEKLKRSTVLISLAHQIVNQMCLQSRKQYKIQDRTITATASCKFPPPPTFLPYGATNESLMAPNICKKKILLVIRVINHLTCFNRLQLI